MPFFSCGTVYAFSFPALSDVFNIERAKNMKRYLLRVFAAIFIVALGGISSVTQAGVLVWGSGSFGGAANVGSWIQSVGGFDTVDTVDTIDSGTLDFEQLDAYESVLYFSNDSTGGNEARGDALADFADTGKRLVLATFSWANQSGNTLAGRLIDDLLSPYKFVGSSLYSTATMAANDGSDFFDGVNTLSGYFRDNVEVVAGATSLASWSDGVSLLARKNNVVGVNLFPDDNFGTVSGDYRNLFVNALIADGEADGHNGGEATVPAPATLALLGLGLLVLRLRRTA